MWSISATLPKDSSPDKAPEMMQALLVARFKLVIHHEKRERFVDTLTVVEGGSKLAVATPGEYPVWDGSFPGFSFRIPLQSTSPITGRISPGPKCTRRYEFIPLPMSAFADALTLFLGKPVVDQTGMEGKYKVTLEMSGESEAGIMANITQAFLPRGSAGGREGGDGGRGAGGDAPPNDPLAPGCADPISLVGEVGSPDAALRKVLQQQLGLRLQENRAQVDTIVIDHLEKTPTEN
jgi:uncharacterized protein (TIGR03435 family)